MKFLHSDKNILEQEIYLLGRKLYFPFFQNFTEFINFPLGTTKGLNNSKNYFVKKIKKKKNMEIEN